MFFFFKQKTAYEMRISDWSSDVCSSDLLWVGPDPDRPPVSASSPVADFTRGDACRNRRQCRSVHARTGHGHFYRQCRQSLDQRHARYWVGKRQERQIRTHVRDANQVPSIYHFLGRFCFERSEIPVPESRFFGRQGLWPVLFPRPKPCTSEPPGIASPPDRRTDRKLVF